MSFRKQRMDEERLLLMAARMIEARQSMRLLLGDKYDSTMEPCRILIRAAMKKQRRSAIAATTEICRRMLDAGADGMLGVEMIAACADVLEEPDSQSKE